MQEEILLIPTEKKKKGEILLIPTGEKREPLEPSKGWKKEFLPSLGEAWKEVPAVKGWSEFITKKIPSLEFWKRAGKNLSRQSVDFLKEMSFTFQAAQPMQVEERHMTPEYKRWYDENIYKSVMEDIEPEGITKEARKAPKRRGILPAAKVAGEYLLFLPKTFDKFAQDPGGTIEKEPLSVLFLAGVLARGGYNRIKTKIKTKKPVTGKDIHQVVDEMPRDLLTKEQKFEIKSKIDGQLELPFKEGVLREGGGIVYGMKLPKEIGATAEHVGIRIDKFNAPYDVKFELVKTVEHIKGDLKTHRVPWAEVEAKAAAKPMAFEDLINSKRNKAFNAVELEQARRLIGASQEILKRKWAKLQETGAPADLLAYRAAVERGGLLVRSFRAKKAVAGQSLNILKKHYETGDFTTRAFERVLNELGGREANAKIAERFGMLDFENPIAVSKFLRDITKPRVSDYVFEVWVNSILSGPLTQARNITSQTLMLMDMPVVRFGTAVVEHLRPSVITGKAKPRVYFGESLAIAKSGLRGYREFGLHSGIREGVKRMMYAWQNEMSKSGITKFETSLRAPAAGAIRGPAGKIIRLPGRVLVSVDELFKGIIGRADLHSMAYRKASLEGLKGRAKAKRIAELIEEPTEGMLEHATGQELARTFQTELGQYAQWLVSGRAKIPGARYIIPFIRVPINIPKQAFYRSPLNFARIVTLAAKGKPLKGAVLSEEIAMAGMGTATAISIFMAAKEGYITGNAPKNKAERESLYATGWRPRSVHIPGVGYLSYEALEPISSVFMMTADIAKIWDLATEGERDRLATQLIDATRAVMVEKTFMRGTFNLFRAISEPERGGEYWLEGLTSSVVPTGVAQIVRAIDPYWRESEGIINSIKARIPFVTKGMPPKISTKGLPVKRETPFKEGTIEAFLYRIASPFYYGTENTTRVDKELADLKIWIGMPSKKIKAGKEYKKLKPEDYSVMSQEIGVNLFRLLDKIMSGEGYQNLSPEMKEKVIRGVVANQRKIGRAPYYKKYRE